MAHAYGASIRYTVDEGLGSQVEMNCTRFDGPKIPAGQVGTYIADTQAAMKVAGRSRADEFEGWHMTSTEVDGQTYFVPVHDSMFEAVDQ